MTSATEHAATVEIAGEFGTTRVGPREDGAELRVGIGTPVRIALLVGRAPSDLIAARAFALASCVDPVVTVRAADVGESLIDRATLLRDAHPAAALLVATDAHGVADLAEAARLAWASDSERPLVLVAATDRVRAKARRSLDALGAEAVPLRTSGGGGAVVARLRALRRGSADVVLRDEAIEAAARTLAAGTRRATTVVDVSGDTTSIVHATPERVVFAAHAHIGVGTAADRIVRRSGIDRVRRWIPRALDAPALLDRVFNRTRWPGAVAATPLTLLLEMALAREAIAQVLAEAARAGFATDAARNAPGIVASGAIASWPRPQELVHAVADALQPQGTHLIARDNGALIASGALAARASSSPAATIEPLALLRVMWPKKTESLTIIDKGGPVDSRVARVQRGSFFLVRATGDVQVRIGRSVDANARDLSLGVVVDARGRPLELPTRDAERLPTLLRWSTALETLPEDVGA